MANKTIAICNALQMLANCLQGLSSKHCRLLYKTVALPVLLYGVQVYFTNIQQAGLVNILQTAQNVGVRWVLGAFKTTPIRAAHHITSIPPVKFSMVKARENAGI